MKKLKLLKLILRNLKILQNPILIFFIKGKKDGVTNDDIIQTKFIGIPAKQLKPSQNAVYLGKSLGMAIAGIQGGDLGAVISSDNRILDGHHRWAATLFNNPSAKN